jgi:hypothetical protein
VLSSSGHAGGQARSPRSLLAASSRNCLRPIGFGRGSAAALLRSALQLRPGIWGRVCMPGRSRGRGVSISESAHASCRRPVCLAPIQLGHASLRVSSPLRGSVPARYHRCCSGLRDSWATEFAASVRARLRSVEAQPGPRCASHWSQSLTMRSSGLRGEAIVFPAMLSARSRLTRR